MKILTISIATYNVADYLEKLLDSLISVDRLEELEILVINDGSKDNTKEKAYKYQQMYPDTIRLIDKENGGHGSTINRGIEEARGVYFKIIDGDDWVNSEGMAKLVDYLKSASEDMILTDYRECYTESDTYKDMSETMKGTREVIPVGEVVEFANIADRLERMQMHMITFKTDMLKQNNIRVDEHCFYVDTEYVFYTLPYIKTASYLDELVYCYRLGRPGQSMTSESLRKHVANHVKVNKGIIKAYGDNRQKVSDAVRQQMNTMLHDVTLLTYRILLSMPCKKVYGDQIGEIDKRLQTISIESYESLDEGWLRTFRKGNYNNYPVVWIKAKGKALVEHMSRK